MNYLQSPAFGQSDMGASSHDVHLIMIFVGVLALAAALQIVVMVIAALTAGKVIKDAKELTERVEGAVLPLVHKASALVDELTPKVRTITENVTEISYTVRSKVDEYGVTAGEVNQTLKEWNRTAQDANLKARAHVAHVDRMVDSTLTQTENLKQTVVHGVTVPVRQAAGVVAGLKAGIEKLVENFAPKKRGTASSAYRESTFTTGSGVTPIRGRDDVAM